MTAPSHRVYIGRHWQQARSVLYRQDSMLAFKLGLPLRCLQALCLAGQGMCPCRGERLGEHPVAEACVAAATSPSRPNCMLHPRFPGL